MVHGVTCVLTITPALDLSCHCPTATLTITVTAIHIMIKQAYNALVLLEVHVPKREMFDCLEEIMTMKEL